MSKQRYISTEIWDDDWFVEELDQREKLFYMYLLTNQYTNIAGIYKVSVRKMSNETGFSQEEIKTHLVGFEKHNKVYYREQYLVMVNWPKHQKWQKSKNIHKGIRAILIKETPKSVLKAIRDENIPYAYPLDTLSRGIEPPDIPLDTPSYPLEPIPNPSNYKDLDFDLNSDLDLNNNKHSYNEKEGEADQKPEPVDNSAAADLKRFVGNNFTYSLEISEEALNTALTKIPDKYHTREYLSMILQDMKAAPLKKNPPGFFLSAIAYEENMAKFKPKKKIKPPVIPKCTCGGTVNLATHNSAICQSCQMIYELKNGKFEQTGERPAFGKKETKIESA